MAEDTLIAFASVPGRTFSMRSKHQDQDILQDLFSNEEADSDATPAVIELTKLIEKYADTVHAKSGKAQRKGVGKSGRGSKRPLSKRKTTHYLSPDTSDALEEAKEEIRSLVSPQLKRLVSKSRIVDMALRHVLDELARQGPKSKLVKHLLRDREGG